jgi:hypothetical protein
MRMSKLRSQTSRLNGAKSRGPKSAAGKQISIDHGLFAKNFVLDGESADRFRALSEALHAQLQPQNAIECGLVENMVICRWRQMRLWVLETARMAHEIRNQAIVNENESKATRAALAFGALSDHSNVLELMNRYETRFDRQYSRCLQRLLEVRARRNILESELFEPELNDAANDSSNNAETETQEKLILQNEPECRSKDYPAPSGSPPNPTEPNGFSDRHRKLPPSPGAVTQRDT